MDLKAVFGPLEAPRAVLAAASFDGFLLTIDYPNQVVAIRPGELPPADGRRVLEYSDRSGVPCVSASFAGEAVDVAIDTGAPSTLAMPLDYVSRLPLESEPAVAGQGRTVDATFDILASRLDGSVRIGDIVANHPEVTFSEPTKQPHVGMGMLRPYAITIDSANRRIMFETPGSRVSRAPARRVVRGGGVKTYGIMLGGLEGDVLEVRGVQEGLPAADAGLREGDRIVALNGKAVKSLGIDERMRRLRASPLMLTVERNGESIEIALTLD
jgi:membrane-associated protease RseP (regulator of RpoE activity)